jgi:hypothetical protein
MVTKAHGGRHRKLIPSPDSSTTDLLQLVNQAGIRFRLVGGQLRVTGKVSSELRPFLHTLKDRVGSTRYDRFR